MTSTLDPTKLPEAGDGGPGGRAGLLARLAAFSARRRRVVITVWLLLVDRRGAARDHADGRVVRRRLGGAGHYVAAGARRDPP